MKENESENKAHYIEGIGWRRMLVHSMHRRMQNHDYQSRCIYMITITTEGRQNLLGTLRWEAGCPDSAYVQRTALGDEVAKCWISISTHYEGVEAFPLMIMPDHIHGILFVKKEIEAHLGQVIKGFKVGCNKAMRELGVSLANSGAMSTFSETLSQKTGLEARKERHPSHGYLFAPGYQDSVLMGRGQLSRMFTYIAENPYRLAIKKENPELFRVVADMQIHGQTFAAIGNRWLLNRPCRLQVRCHNNQSPENLSLISKQKDYFLQRGSKGGVIVSPCISFGEKEIARSALEAGLPLIVILENGFPPMYKPPGKYFEACANGHLLMLAPWPYHMEKRTITRAQCNALNDFAKMISTDPWTEELEMKLKTE